MAAVPTPSTPVFSVTNVKTARLWLSDSMKVFKKFKVKNMYQKAKRMFSFDSEKKNNSHSLPKSERRKDSAVYTDESEDAPTRFSYFRASNSLRRYNSVPQRELSAGEGSLGSSREDLLDAPLVLARRKRPNVSKQLSGGYKSGNSSSEDLLYDESDYTEDPLSTAVVETDGSVFSSQENLSDVSPRCSENVSRFLRRQSTIDRRRSSGSPTCLDNPAALEDSAESHQSQDKGKDKLDYFAPVCPTTNEKGSYNGNQDHPTKIMGSPSIAVEGTVSEDSLCPIKEPILSDNKWPVMYRIQMAVTKTIRRLADHIETVKEHVEILEKKCNNLKVTLYYLQEDHDALKVKISKLEELIEQREARQSEDSEDDEYLDCIDYSPVQGIYAGSLSSVEHIVQDSTVGKADTIVTAVGHAQDSKTYSTVFTSVSSVAEHISVSHI